MQLTQLSDFQKKMVIDAARGVYNIADRVKQIDEIVKEKVGALIEEREFLLESVALYSDPIVHMTGKTPVDLVERIESHTTFTRNGKEVNATRYSFEFRDSNEVEEDPTPEFDNAPVKQAIVEDSDFANDFQKLHEEEPNQDNDIDEEDVPEFDPFDSIANNEMPGFDEDDAVDVSL